MNISLDTKSLKEFGDNLLNFARNLNFKKPMSDTGDVLVYESKKNIDTQGFYYGSFKPLKASTKRDRQRHGYSPSRPILVRSGHLKKGFFKQVGYNQVAIDNREEYAEYHQDGTRNMPQRTILGTSRQSENAIGQIFENYIYDEIMKALK